MRSAGVDIQLYWGHSTKTFKSYCMQCNSTKSIYDKRIWRFRVKPPVHVRNVKMRTCTHHVVFFKVIKTHEIFYGILMMDCCVANLRSRIDALVPELAKLASVEPRCGRHHKWLEPSYSRVEVDCIIQYTSPKPDFFSGFLSTLQNCWSHKQIKCPNKQCILISFGLWSFSTFGFHSMCEHRLAQSQIFLQDVISSPQLPSLCPSFHSQEGLWLCTPHKRKFNMLSCIITWYIAQLRHPSSFKADQTTTTIN